MVFSTDSVNRGHDKMMHIVQPFGIYDIVMYCVLWPHHNTIT